jgi:hypothetical protein
VLGSNSRAWGYGRETHVARRVRGLAQVLTDHLGSQEQVVVVNDDEISGAVDLGDLFSEQAVGLVVVNPRWVGRRHSSR